MGAIHQALLGVGGAGGGTPSTPTPILHLKADAITGLSNGDSVTTWEDSSPSGNDAAQGTAAQKPTYLTNAIGSGPAVYFDGADALSLASSIAVGTGAFSALIVYRRTTTAAHTFYGGGVTTVMTYELGTGTAPADGRPQISNGTAGVSFPTTNWRNGGWAQAGFAKTSGATSTVTHRLRAAANGSDADTVNYTNPITTIGAKDSSGTAGLKGYIAELILFDVELDSGQIDEWEAYLNDKYDPILTQVRLAQWEADAITGLSDTDNVTEWKDSSGQGQRAFAGATIPTYRTNVQNSLPAVRFGSTSTAEMLTEAMCFTAPFTIYIVYSYRSPTAANRRAIQGSQNWLLGPYQNTHQGYGGSFSVGPAVVENVFAVAAMTYDGTNQHYVNNVTEDAAGVTAPGVIGFGAAGSAGSEPLNGDILEVIIEHRVDDSTQRTAIYDYLFAKYAL